MDQAQYRVFRYQSFYIDRRQSLGHGSYGAVYKAKCDQLPCAAKLIHTTILDPTDPGSDKIMQRFKQECVLLEGIRHPNIVQYLGMTRDPESRLPVLLMELLDESLTKMLERSQQPLPHCIQVDICYDIALAVAYLHSNDIIHRDLSSNNVLMIAGRRAKVTDFGMSKLAVAASTMTPLTMCPGTLAYMAPEALKEPPRYTKKLDCFSEGVIMIQVCTRLWPEPGPRTMTVHDSRYPTGTIEVPKLDTERRKNHIDLINPSHALLPIAMVCINYQEIDRPSSEELCQRLASLRESSEYKDSVQENYDNIQAKDNLILSQNQQLRDKDSQLQQQRRMHQEEKREIQTLHQQDISRLEEEKAQLQEEIASQERQFQQLNKQLKEKEQVTAEIQHTNHSLQRQVDQLQYQLSQQNLPDHNPHHPKVLTMTLNWRDGGMTPFKMHSGAVVVDGNVAYFMHPTGEACCYYSISKKWSKLRRCPYQHCSLAVIHSQVTAIGGCLNHYENHSYTNRLLSLHESWVDVFPPMPTRRGYTTAITSKEHLIVAGGLIGLGKADRLSTVEVMDAKTLVWSTVASLPHPYTFASAAICGDQLYMLGGYSSEDKTNSVFACSVTSLLQSPSSAWHRVVDAPARGSNFAAINGELLAVGGYEDNYRATSAIHKYNPTTNSWDLISNMPTARWSCLVAFLPTNEMMAVGGVMSNSGMTDKVEIADCSFS